MLASGTFFKCVSEDKWVSIHTTSEISPGRSPLFSLLQNTDEFYKSHYSYSIMLLSLWGSRCQHRACLSLTCTKTCSLQSLCEYFACIFTGLNMQHVVLLFLKFLVPSTGHLSRLSGHSVLNPTVAYCTCLATRCTISHCPIKI